jgi:hypothetical protein
LSNKVFIDKSPRFNDCHHLFALIASSDDIQSSLLSVETVEALGVHAKQVVDAVFSQQGSGQNLEEDVKVCEKAIARWVIPGAKQAGLKVCFTFEALRSLVAERCSTGNQVP